MARRLSKSEQRALRRALPSVAVAQAKLVRSEQGERGDEVVILSPGGGCTASASPSRSGGGRDVVGEPLHSTRAFMVRRHAKNSYTLHSAPGNDFLLSARMEGGGLGSFFRIYNEPAASGLTPGKAAASYIGKVEKGGLYIKRGKQEPKVPSVMFSSSSARQLADGTKRDVVVTIDRPDGAAQLSLSSVSSAAAYAACGGFCSTPLDRPITGMIPSTKNLALVSSEEGAAAGVDKENGGAAAFIMRLGKTGPDEFAMFCGAPLSPLQGFAIALCAVSS